jgi:maltooligosyltrehalose trehalohydrolase
VVCSQNHDQVGNRAKGDRLTALLEPEALRLAAAVILTSPCTPLLFMGEEHGEPRPFPYFTSHGDAGLVEAVRRGRREEFATFGWGDDVPDPQDPSTFEQAVLGEPDVAGQRLREFYRELLRWRRELPREGATAEARGESVLLATRGHGAGAVHFVFRFAPSVSDVDLELPDGRWRRRFDTAGDDTAVPARLEVSGSSIVRLAPWQAVAFSRSH